MKLLALLLFLASPTSEELIEQLEHDEYKVREQATAMLVDRLGEEREPILYKRLQAILKEPNTPPESLWRIHSAFTQFYKIGDEVHVPIWCLSKERRYVEDQDLALLYYEAARRYAIENKINCHCQRTPSGIVYNDQDLMWLATQFYFKDMLDQRVLTRDQIRTEIRNITEQHKDETNFQRAFVFGHSLRYASLSFKVPKPYEERLQELKTYGLALEKYSKQVEEATGKKPIELDEGADFEDPETIRILNEVKLPSRPVHPEIMIRHNWRYDE